MDDEVLFEDGIMLLPIDSRVDLNSFSEFYISGLGFLCAKKPYQVVLYSEPLFDYHNEASIRIHTKDIIGVEKQFIKIKI